MYDKSMLPECWYCFRWLMRECSELGSGWYKCECGATWVEFSRPGKWLLGKIWRIDNGCAHYHSVPIRNLTTGELLKGVNNAKAKTMGNQAKFDTIGISSR